MGPQQTVIIERPPYYHPPRSRPIGLEKPIHCCDQLNTGCCPKVHVYIAKQHNHAQFSSQGNQQEHQASYIRSSNQEHTSSRENMHVQTTGKASTLSQINLSNLPSYNNLPRPFCKDSHNDVYKQGIQYESVPKILINDQTSMYPTSTVHKSMLNSGQSSRNSSSASDSNIQVGPNYAKLISPTLMTTSYEATTVGSYEPLSSISRNTSNLEPTSNKSCSASNHHQHHSGESRTQSGGSNSTLKTANSAAKELASERLQTVLAGPASYGKDLSKRPLPMITNQAAKMVDSNTVLPDSKRAEFMWDRQLERASIAHQTYRTLPIVMPKPKARHDLASGIYMGLNYDPTWDLAQSKTNSSGLKRSADYVDNKIQQAINSQTGTGSGQYGLMGQSNLTCANCMTQMCSSCPNQDYTIKDQGGASLSSSNVSPAFNYREYIESTRRAI